MKKITILCIAVMFLCYITSCATRPHHKAENDTEDVDIMNQEGPDPMQNIESASSGAAPQYPTMMFENVDELIEWIKTEDLDNFQEGRYNNGVSSLRNKGELLVPSYEDNLLKLGFIEILPDYHYSDKYSAILFYFYVENEQGERIKKIVVSTNELNPTNARFIQRDGLHGYLDAQYGDEFSGTQVAQATIENKIPLQTREEKVSYVMDSSEEVGFERAVFLTDDFEVRVVQDYGKWDDKYLNELSLEMAVF